LLYLLNLVQLNLGKSFFYRQDVATLVWEVFPNTIVLTLAALIVAYVIGIVLGATLAWKRNSVLEKIALPVVLVLLAVFSFSLGWLPSGGTLEAGTERGSFLTHMFNRDFLAHLFLPAATLA